MDGRYLTPQPFFLPPLPPAFGASIPEPWRGAVFNGTAYTPPEGLADFVGECFYPALAARLRSHGPSAELRSRLAEYQKTRDALVKELTGRVAELEYAPREVRHGELRALAAKQTPQVISLEAEAEAIRDALSQGGLFDTRLDWTERVFDDIDRIDRFNRSSGNAAARAVNEARAHRDLVLAGLYFEKGVSAAQRELLTELALEFRAESMPSAPQLKIDSADTFFAPSGARFRLPPSLPSELSKKIGVYNRDKRLLKYELIETLMALSGLSDEARERALILSADAQRSRLAALASLAEEIRCDLAALPPVRPASLPDMAISIVERFQKYQADRAALYAELDARLKNEPVPAAAPARSPAANSVRSRTPAAEISRQFRQENQERFDALDAEIEGIRRDLAEYARTHPEDAIGPAADPDALLRKLTEAAEHFHSIGRQEAIYGNYRIAMLEPGLSPEQRRLLFNGAIVGLAQPLPDAVAK
jgi:hypothetical protein